MGSAIFLVHPDGTGLHAIGNRHLELGGSPPLGHPTAARSCTRARRRTARRCLRSAPTARGRGRCCAGASSSQPSFSPDGRHIAFISFNATNRIGIWVVGADGRGARPLHVAPGEKTFFHYPVYSPDGRSIAFILQGAWQRIAVIRADGSGQRAVSPRARFIGGLDWARR